MMQEDALASFFTMKISEYNSCLVHHDEIELAGKMYDVVSACTEGEFVYVKAIRDDHETGLLKRIFNFLETAEAGDSDISLEKAAQLIYLSSAYTYNSPMRSFLVFDYSLSRSLLIAALSDVAVPPPQRLS